jgi:hypothetical protein
MAMPISQGTPPIADGESALLYLSPEKLLRNASGGAES